MKYVLEINIDSPRDVVTKLFSDADQYINWQPDIVDVKPHDNHSDENIKKATLINKHGKKEIKIEETIFAANLPEKLVAIYETQGIWNKIENHFVELNPYTTRWKLVNELKCSGLSKFVAMLIPFIFRRQSHQYMQQFKEYAERI